MPENNFEKNVQQRMDELKIQPAETIWGKVYEKIRKEKKRRRFIVWFFLLAFLLLGAGAWWIIKNNNSRLLTNQNNSPIGAKEHIDKTAIDNQTKEVTVAGKQIGDQELTDAEKNFNESVKNKNVSNGDLKIPGKNKNEISARYNNDDSRTEIERKTILVNDDNIKYTDSSLSENSKQKITDSASALIQENNSKNLPDSPKAARPDVPIQSNDSVQQLSSLLPKDKESMKKSNWEWKIIGGIGISNITNGIFEFFNYSGSPMADYTSSPGTGPSAPQYQQPPSSPTNGIAWELGVQAKRKLNNKIALSTGLGFSSYSNLQKTGSFKDTTVVVNNGINQVTASGIYRNGGTESFTNHFYYLEVPVILHWQLNKGFKIPITWQNGISFGQLVSSDALFYNASSNIFYQDKNLMNKTQWVYRTGFSAGLFNETKHQVTAGLQFNYHLRSLQKQRTAPTNHMTSLGIQLGWIINK